MAEDIRQDKKGNFSALMEHNSNGVTRSSALAASKTGASKKLVIKNFKGKAFLYELNTYRYVQCTKNDLFFTYSHTLQQYKNTSGFQNYTLANNYMYNV